MKRAAAAAPVPGRSQAGARVAGPAAHAAVARAAGTKPLPAYVLHRYDWSETSVIVDLFTRERGRLAVAAKGAKRPYSQLRGVLLPFQRLQIALARSGADTEVHTLRSAEWAGGAPMLGGDALFAGFYLNELLLRLLARQDPHAALFDAYAQTLPLLAAADDAASQAALRAFELTLLREIGVLPDLGSVTPTAAPLLAQAAYVLHPESGLVPATGGEPALRGAQWVALQAALQHGSIAALQAECAGALPLLRARLRALLQYHLGSYTLRTRRLLAELRGFVATHTPSR